MPPYSHSKPEKESIEAIIEKLEKAGEMITCGCGKRIHKYWHIKTGPKGNTTYPLMDECAPCTFNN